jgi:hypothetical protein
MHRRLRLGVPALLTTLALAGLSPALASAESIGGTVTADGSGNPVQNVCIGVFRTVAGTFVNGSLTAADGSYTVSFAESGSFKVLFTTVAGGGCPGPQTTVTEWYLNKADQASATEVVVPAAGAVTGINGQVAPFVAPSTGSISGTVENFDGSAGIEDVCVFALDPASQFTVLGSAQTGLNGVYEISNLPTGSYKVGFTTDFGCAGVTTRITGEYYDDAGTDFAAADAVSVTAGSTTANVDALVEILATANDDAQGVNEDATATNISVLANDVDGDATGANEVTAVSDPPNGTAAKVDAVTDSVNYTPDANFCGTDTFTYTITGGDTATVTVTVTCVNDPPAGTNGSVAASEDTDYVFAAADFGFTDVDAGDSLSFVRVDSLPAQGTLRLDNGLVSPSQLIPAANLNAGQFTYTPPANQCGAPFTTFTFSVADGSSAFDPSPNTLTVNVTCANDAPAGTNGTATTNEDTSFAFAGSNFGFTDADSGDSLSAVRVDTLPAQGTLRLSGTPVTTGDVIASASLTAGNLTYSPPANACGAPLTSFTFSVRDSSNAFDPTPNTLGVNVTCVDDAPVALDDAAIVPEDNGSTPIPVLANDSDVEGDPFVITSKTNGANGIVFITGGGTGLTFAPNADFCGPTSFTYTVTGGDSATVSVTVTCIDDAAVAATDAATVNEDSGANNIAVLANDGDAENNPFEITAVTDPPHGTAAKVDAATDSINYTPDAGYCGADSFVYTVTGGDTATVNITVTCVDDTPTAVNDSPTASEDGGAQSVDVLANDTDSDAGPKTVASKTDGSSGSVAIAGDGGSVTYTPNANFCGSDSFGYTLNGGSAGTVNITVTCVDDNPVAVNDARTVAEDSPATSIDVLANDTDIDNGTKVVASAADAPHGTVTNTASNVTYTPDANYCGPDSFTYALNGGSSATVAMTVTCVDDTVPDTTAPDTTITKGPKKRITTSRRRVRVKFAFRSSEPNSTFQCKLDNGAFKACSSPKAYRLKPGRHKFRVRAIDAAGNVDPTPAVRKVRVIRA